MAEVDNAKDEQGEGCRCQSQEWAVLGGPGPGPRPRPRWGFREWNEAQGSLGSIISPLQNNSKNKLQQSFSRRRSRASEACVSQTTGELGKRSDGETEQTESRRTGAEEKALSHYVQLLSQLWPRRGPAHKRVGRLSVAKSNVDIAYCWHCGHGRIINNPLANQEQIHGQIYRPGQPQGPPSQLRLMG